MNILIAGCTETGARLAGYLSRRGHEISIIDPDSESFKSLPQDFSGLTAVGIPIDCNVLENAGVENCDAFLACCDNDNMNIVSCQVASDKYGVEKSVAVVDDPSRKKVFQTLGMSTVCTTNLTRKAVVDIILDNANRKTVKLGDNIIGFMTRDAKKYVGKAINELPVFPHENFFAVIDKNGNLHFVDLEYTIGEGEKIVFSQLVD